MLSSARTSSQISLIRSSLPTSRFTREGFTSGVGTIATAYDLGGSPDTSWVLYGAWQSTHLRLRRMPIAVGRESFTPLRFPPTAGAEGTQPLCPFRFLIRSDMVRSPGLRLCPIPAYDPIEPYRFSIAIRMVSRQALRVSES